MVVIELGRRVEFDFTKYGHTPTCLDRGDQELVGKIATVQVTHTCDVYVFRTIQIESY